MYHQSFEPKRKRRGRRWLLILLLLGVLGGAGYAGMTYGPQLYYGLTGDAIVRLERRSVEFEARLGAWGGGEAALPDLLGDLAEMRRIAQIQTRNTPVDAAGYFYLALTDFYELVLRVALDGESLLELTGRGYLPLQRKTAVVPAVVVPRLSQRISRNTRRALALDPDLDARDRALLLLIAGDLFFTERTDANLALLLAEYREKAGDAPQPGVLGASRDWLSFGLLTLAGKARELQPLLAGTASPGADGATEAEAQGSEQAAASRLQLDQNQRDLLLCHSHYYAREFLPALRLARQVKYRAGVSDALKQEAVRMEAEIFLLQRGATSACFFFAEAGRIGPDEFIAERMQSVCPTTPGR